MPRSIDPGSITVGKGRVPQGTVEDNSLRNPNRDVQPLKAHIDDPSRAHFAKAVAIEDIVGNFSSDEVEGALAELAGSTSAGRLNGWLEGGTFSTVGLTLTLDTPSSVLLNGTRQDYSGVSVALVDNTTQYVFIDVSTGTLVTSGVAPTLTSEDILVAEVTALAGVVTASRDGRWFVLNIDRKPPLTVRSVGTDTDTASEANFSSIVAALLYLELYAGSGTDPVETHRIIVRGNHVVSSTLTIPVPGVIFEGDGAGSFTTGGVVSPLFDVGGNDHVKFINLKMVCNHAGCKAISGGAASHLQVIDTQIIEGLDKWDEGISLTSGTQTQCSVIRSQIDAAQGIDFNDPFQCVVQDSILNGDGEASGLNGITLSGITSITTGRSLIRGCIIKGYSRGISTTELSSSIVDTHIQDVQIGLICQSPGAQIRNVRVELGITEGVIGFRLTNAHNVKLHSCLVSTNRPSGSYGALTPVGVLISGCQRVSILDIHLTGIFSSTSPSRGVSADSSSKFLNITGGFIDSVSTAIRVGGDRFKISGVVLSGVGQGVDVQGDHGVISDITGTIAITYGVYGFSVTGSTDVQITNCSLELLRIASWSGETPYGISFSGCTHCAVSNSAFSSFYNITDDLGFGALISTSDHISVSSCEFSGSKYGIRLDGTDHVRLVGNTLIDLITTGIDIIDTGSQNIICDGNSINGGQITLIGIQVDGVTGGGTRTRDVTLSNNIIEACTTDHILISRRVDNCSVVGNSIDGFLDSDDSNPTAEGIHVTVAAGSASSNLSISGNVVWRCRNGVSLEGAQTDPLREVSVTANKIRYCGYAQNVSGGVPDTYEGRGSKGLGAEFVKGLRVTGNTIEQIGYLINNADTGGFPDQGGLINDVQSNGIYFRNCDRPSVTDNTISDLRGNGSDPSGATDVYGIRLESQSTGSGGNDDTTSTQILNNTVTYDTTLLGNPMLFGVSVSAGRGTDVVGSKSYKGLQINGNSVLSVGRAHIQVVVEEACSVLDGQVNDNVLKGVTNAGVTGILVSAPAVGVAPGNFMGLSVSGNRIHSPDDGITFSIKRNTNLIQIRVNDNSCHETQNRGLDFDLSGGSHSDIQVCRNQLNDYELNGIRVMAPTGVSLLERVEISSNTLSTFGTTSPHIHLIWGGFNVYGLGVSNNTILGSGVNGVGGGNGISIVGQVLGGVRASLDCLSVRGNKVHLSNQVALDVSLDGTLTNATVLDNILRSDGVGTNVVNFTLQPASPVANDSHDNITFQGNLVRGGGDTFKFSAEDSKINDLTIKGNQFEDAGGTLLSFILTEAHSGADPSLTNTTVSHNTFRKSTALGADLSLGVNNAVLQNDPHRGLQVSHNTFYQVGTSNTSGLRIRVFGQSQNFKIDHNTFSQCCGVGDTTGLGVILFQVGSTDKNASISSNAMTDCGTVGINYTDFSGASFWASYNLRIHGNQIYNQKNDAIRVDWSGFSSLTEQLSIHNNVVDGTTSLTQDSQGIHVISAATQPIKNLSIQGNILSNIEAFDPTVPPVGAAIKVEAFDDLLHSQIHGNIIENSNDHGIYVEVDGILLNGQVDDNAIEDCADNGIYVGVTGVDATSYLEAFSCSGNTVTGMAAGTGISVMALNSTVAADSRAVTINGNSISNITTSEGILFGPQGGDNDVDGLTINGNTIESTGDDGIAVSFSGSGTLQSMNINGNTLSGIGDVGILVGSVISANPINTLSVSHNTMTTVQTAGISIGSTVLGIPSSDLNGIVVNGNNIRNFNSVAALHGGISILGATSQNVTVSNNTVRTPFAGGSICYRYLISGLTRTMVMTGNTAHNESAAASESMRWDSGAGSNQASMTFTGNSFRSSAGGISINGSSFAPSDSAVVGNTSSNIGGAAQQWGTGASGFTSHFSSSVTANNQG